MINFHTNLRAFHNSQVVKDLFVARVKAHQLADEIIQGTYWERGKGCAVGCTIHGSDHRQYESQLGIPRQLAYLQDRLFEGLSNGEAKSFPLSFLLAIPVGADLSLVLPHFLIWLLEDEKDGVIRFATERGKKAIATVAALYRRVIAGEKVTEQEWRAADAAAADAAAADAADAAAADAAAYAAAYAYAADAAAYAYAADAAAYAADAAADAAAYAADAAAYAADAAAADAAAADAARKAHFVKMRDKLLTLLAEAPMQASTRESEVQGV